VKIKKQQLKNKTTFKDVSGCRLTRNLGLIVTVAVESRPFLGELL
jgi:hypothetical protein